MIDQNWRIYIESVRPGYVLTVQLGEIGEAEAMKAYSTEYGTQRRLATEPRIVQLFCGLSLRYRDVVSPAS